MKDKDSEDKISELRRLAEQAVEKSLGVSDVSALSPEEIQRLVHELQVYQIELEMQNEELRRTQQDLEASRDKYLELYDLAPVGYFTLDQNGLILEANLTSANLFGVERGLLIGRPLASFVNEEDGNTLYLHFRQVLETQSKQTCDIRLANKDGNEVSLRLETLVLGVQGESLQDFRTAVIDITRRREVEVELKESEERFRSLYENVPLGYQSLDENGYFLEVNRAWLDILGYSREDVIGKWFGDFLAPGYRERFKTNFAKFKATGASHWDEFEMIRKDGSLITVGLDGQVGRDGRGQFRQTHCILHDISQIKRSEESLRQSEQRFRLMFQTHDAIMLLIEPNTGKIVDANRSAQRFYGYGLSELLQMGIQQINTLPPDEVSQERKRALLEERNYFVFQHRLASGEVRTVEVHSCPIAQEGTKLLFSIIHDITKRSRAEENLRQKREELQIILDSVPALIFYKDINNNIINANKTWLQTFGYTEHDVIGKCLAEIFPSEQAAELFRDDLEVITTGHPKQNILEVIEIDGQPRTFLTDKIPYRNTNGDIIGVIGISHDITDRRRAEEALRESEEKYRTLFEESFDGLFITSPGGKILDMNKKGVAMFGYDTKEEILSLDLERDVYAYPLDRKRIIAMVNAQGSTEYEVVVKKKSGEEMITHCALTAVKDKRGVITSYRGIIRDITELAQVRLRLENERAMLRTLVQTIPDLVWLKDPDGTYLTCNPRFERFFGAKESDIVGKTDYDFVDADLADFFRDHDRKSMDAGKPSINEEWITFADDGHRELLETIKTPMYDNDGSLVGVLGIGRNITAAREAEEALKEANSYNRSLIEASLDPLVTISAEGKITDVNKATEWVTGYSRDELIGTDFADYFTDPQRCREGYQRAFTEGMVRDYELQIRHRDGDLTAVMYNASVYHDRSGEIVGVFAAARDITERKISEELIHIRLNLLEFAASHPLDELLQRTLDEIGALTNSPIGFYHFVESDQKTLPLQAWSARTVKEFCKAEGKGQHYSIDRAGVWADCIRERKPVIHNDYSSLPHRKGMPEGHAAITRELVVPIIKSGQIVAVLGIGNKPTGYTEKDIEVVSYFADVAWEINTRKRAQEALKESEQQYRTLFEESIDGVYSVLRDGTITDANRSFCELFGYSRQEMIGKDIRELYFDPADRPRFQKEIEKQGFVKDYEVKFRKRDGIEVDCLISSSLIFEEDGSITGYRGIVRDLTTRKELHRQLQQAQKMEAVGTLAGGIAHDFNNILQVVLGYSELVLADEHLPDRLRDDLGRVLQAGKNGADLVQRLLTFSRKTETKPLNLDLNQRIRQTQKFLERTIPKMIDIQMILADDLARIYADPTQVDQVLMNLAVNARDAMPEGGKLVIETAQVFLDEESDKALLGVKPGEYVLLSVSDTGHGMDKETLAHIFEPFYTTKEAGKGTGLGLAMVYGIVHQHGGYITCYSEPRWGTTFKMYFPVIEMEMNPDVATTGIMPAFGTETILLVDDEEFVRDLGKRILERSGYTVLTAANGKEALDLYRREREKISLVILDIIMPEMGGKQCLEELLKIDPQVKTLIASGFAADEQTKETIETGARGFVGKPYNVKGMLQAVREVLDSE